VVVILKTFVETLSIGVPEISVSKNSLSHLSVLQKKERKENLVVFMRSLK
jgi:hypothetical protein